MQIDKEKLTNFVMDEIRLFYPFYNGIPAISYFSEYRSQNTQIIHVNIDEKSYEFTYDITSERDLITSFKLSVYKALVQFTGKVQAWGSLTGIRPTKLAYEFLADGGKDIVKYLSEKYCVSPKKSLIISDIIRNQEGFSEKNPKFINLYVHIPFCPSRCGYCSFISLDCKKYASLIEPYIKALVTEIDQTKAFLAAQGYEIYSIYVGGGTPTSINDSQLREVLEAASVQDPQTEFTVEAGRPDTITSSNLKIIKECGANRISINPQTFNDKTLVMIGRNHTAKDIEEVFEYATRKGFIINTDLIAGLPEETIDDFNYTLDKTLQLSPHNITVHTLARKNGSKYKLNELEESADAEKMTDASYERLTANGYIPYYLYRQKSMMRNLENIGYTKPGFQCKNNITVMEEFLSVMACGAGAISKRIDQDGKIERLANLRDVELYLKEFQPRLDKKLKFFEKNKNKSI